MTEPMMDAAQLAEFMTGAFGAEWTWPIERVDGAGVRMRMPAADTMLRPGGTVSGPSLMMLADTGAYLVVLSRIGPEALAVTTNLDINFLRRPRPGDVVCDSSMLKLGRSLAVVDVRMYTDEGTGDDPARGPIVAQATVTYSMALVGSGLPDHTPPRT